MFGAGVIGQELSLGHIEYEIHLQQPDWYVKSLELSVLNSGKTLLEMYI